jgi:predicted nucleotidyltransferase
MTGQSVNANIWRIEMAQQLALTYGEHAGVKMVVLGGSPTRGLADQYSDLDIIVYWSEMDRTWLEATPLEHMSGTRVASKQMADGAVYLESYKFGPLKADFGHLTIESWEEWIGSVINDLNSDGGLQKMISGFLSSIPLYGEALVNEWKQRIPAYPDGMAEKMVDENLRLFVEGCLLHQGWDRGDLLFYYDGLSLMFKRLLAILAALNRVYFSADEPRWIEYELEQMKIKPPDTWGRICSAYKSPGPKANTILEELVADVILMVRTHMPEVDLSRLERRKSLSVLPCVNPPQF